MPSADVLRLTPNEGCVIPSLPVTNGIGFALGPPRALLDTYLSVVFGCLKGENLLQDTHPTLRRGVGERGDHALT
jgi:hypothetical protein